MSGAIMTALTLPTLAGSRHSVVRLLDHIPTDLNDVEIVVYANDLVSAAPSFADELCKEILVTRCAARLVVESASERLAFYLERSAHARGVADRLVVTDRLAD
ncbi:hypothetical protein D2E46_07210 [Mycobacteroides abscessus]|nr:hypothetical protein D2E46_07210 [Mycobacteroides abscessus]